MLYFLLIKRLRNVRKTQTKKKTKITHTNILFTSIRRLTVFFLNVTNKMYHQTNDYSTMERKLRIYHKYLQKKKENEISQVITTKTKSTIHNK